MDALSMFPTPSVARRGSIQLVTGPMFSGKTTELLHRLRRLGFAKRRVMLVRYCRDTRYSADAVATHDRFTACGANCKTFSVGRLSDLPPGVANGFDVVGIDEGQFFPDLVEFADRTANAGKLVIISALDGDFLRQPFGGMCDLVPRAESFTKLTAICQAKGCGRHASYSTRISAETGVEVIGGADKYIPTCRFCYNRLARRAERRLKARQARDRAASAASAASASSAASSDGASSSGDEDAGEGTSAAAGEQAASSPSAAEEATATAAAGTSSDPVPAAHPASDSPAPAERRTATSHSPVSVLELTYDRAAAAASSADKHAEEDDEDGAAPETGGRLELVIGPMFSGKTTQMLHRIRRHGFANRRVLLVKYCKDQRYSVAAVATHDNVTGGGCDTLSVAALAQVGHAYKAYDVIGVDEGQFYSDLGQCVDRWASEGKTVIVAALDGDFLRNPFGDVCQLIPRAEQVCKITAVCMGCGCNASFSRRISAEQDVEVIGGADKYLPTCRECYHNFPAAVTAASTSTSSTTTTTTTTGSPEPSSTNARGRKLAGVAGDVAVRQTLFQESE